MDKELKKIIEKYANCNRKNVFSKYKKEILLLKENCVTLKGILEYLFKKDEELKKRYENRINTALAHLSRTIRTWQKNAKSNIEGKVISQNNKPAPVSNQKKEIKNETAEVKEKQKVNPAEILNSDIFATDDEYKNLL